MARHATRSSPPRSSRPWSTQQIQLLRWVDLDPTERDRLRSVLPGPDLPGADAAGGGPGPPVPLHLRPVAQPGRGGARPGSGPELLRPGEGAQQRAPVRVGELPGRTGGRTRGRRAARGRPGSFESRNSSRPTSANCSPAWRSSSTTCSGSPATPTWKSTTTADEDLLQALETGTGPAPVRSAGPARGRRHHVRLRAGPAGAGAGRMDEDHVVRGAGSAGPLAAVAGTTSVDRPDLKYRPFVPATPPLVRRRETPAERVLPRSRDGDILVHHPYAVVQHQCPALHRAGGGRPARAGDQADALPHQR